MKTYLLAFLFHEKTYDDLPYPETQIAGWLLDNGCSFEDKLEAGKAQRVSQIVFESERDLYDLFQAITTQFNEEDIFVLVQRGNPDTWLVQSGMLEANGIQVSEPVDFGHFG